MAFRTMPDERYVREVLDYCPDSGVFLWRERRPEHFHADDWPWRQKIWNKKFAKKRAGWLNNNGYRLITLGRPKRKFTAHRLAWFLMHGHPIPSEIDHIDGDRDNNRIINLRIATHADNCANSKMRLDNTTGVKGAETTRGGRLRVVIKRHGIKYLVGTFDTFEDAKVARKKAAERLHGEFSREE